MVIPFYCEDYPENFELPAEETETAEPADDVLPAGEEDRAVSAEKTKSKTV